MKTLVEMVQLEARMSYLDCESFEDSMTFLCGMITRIGAAYPKADGVAIREQLINALRDLYQK